jgi:hypothetical protein
MEESSMGDGLELDRCMDTAGAAAGHATDAIHIMILILYTS